jgi:serine/threonine protein kinase
MGQLNAKLEDKYYLQKVKLGQGSFGVVWKGIEKETSTFVAVKQMDKAVLPKRGVKREDIEREVSVMKVVKHDNILQLLDFYEDSSYISFVLEYCDGGDFGDKVKERGETLTEDEAAVWTRMIVSSIMALHRKDVCHRDIKPDNFMVSRGVIKLADFGLAISVPQGKMLTERCGTPAFMAPEQHNLSSGRSRGYSHSVDMWAAGITMFMLLSGGRHPFVTSDNKLNTSALKEGALDFSSQQGLLAVFGQRRGFSESARTLCKSMVNPDTRARITAEVALKNTWLMTPNVAPAPVAAKPSPSKCDFRCGRFGGA